MAAGADARPALAAPRGGIARVAQAAPGDAAAGGFVDAVLAEVEGRVITASDVALARALGAFGLAPSAAPIGEGDLDAVIHARLVLAEAERLGMGTQDEDAEDAWRAAAARMGGAAARDAWLARAGVEPAWARSVAADDAAWRRYIDLRFRNFVFVTEDEVSAALGPGAHDEAARERARAALRERQVQARLDEWLRETVARAAIRRALAPGTRVPSPLPMP